MESNRSFLEKKIDGAKLIKMVESGKHQQEIMKAFKFSTAAQSKTRHLDALMKAGKTPEIKSGRRKAKANSAKEVLVSKRGSVVIPKSMIDEMGFYRRQQVHRSQDQIRDLFGSEWEIVSALIADVGKKKAGRIRPAFFFITGC